MLEETCPVCEGIGYLWYVCDDEPSGTAILRCWSCSGIGTIYPEINEVSSDGND